jgi:hypothetical protein
MERLVAFAGVWKEEAVKIRKREAPHSGLKRDRVFIIIFQWHIVTDPPQRIKEKRNPPVAAATGGF